MLILLKVLHARVQVFVKNYRETHTSRFSNSSQGDGPLRTVLNYSTKKKNSEAVEVKAKKLSGKETPIIKERHCHDAAENVNTNYTIECDAHLMIHEVENNISEVQLLNSASEIAVPDNAMKRKRSNKEQNDIITEVEEHVMIHDVENNIREVQPLNSTSEITGPANAKKRKRNKNSTSMEQNDIMTKCEVTPASSKNRKRKNNSSYKEQTESQLLNPTSETMHDP